MRLSGEVKGLALLVELEGVRHPGLAVGHAGLHPFTGVGPGGSLFALGRLHGLTTLASLDELPFSAPVDARWCVHRDEEGDIAVFGPGGLVLAYDLHLELPPGWQEAAAATGSLLLLVSHVLPPADDMVGVLMEETRQGTVCSGRVRFGPPDLEAAGPPTVTYVLDALSVLAELALHVRDRVLPLEAAKLRARELEAVRRSLEAEHGLSAEAMLDQLTADGLGSRCAPAEMEYLHWRLVTEVAEACGAEAVWRAAALRTVETAAPVVADRRDRAVFEEADAVATRLVEKLEGSVDPAGSEGLPAVLLAAARLRLAVSGRRTGAATSTPGRGGPCGPPSAPWTCTAHCAGHGPATTGRWSSTPG
ncbi:hypothetical protein [Streptomyces sp. SM11]|uniref:hypothetical protein n=1 Tax=Streptomyces sp. SM11 TaxID=565557 RepID=UPI000CD5B24E|nr:hypothetical protein [Streptomyces sp. SM11]